MMLIAIKASWFTIGTGIIFLTFKKRNYTGLLVHSSLILLHWLIGYKFR